MRIVHVVDYIQPKLGYQEYFLPRAQLADGHEVYVVTSDRYSPFLAYDGYAAPLIGPRLLQPGVREEDGVCIHHLRSHLEYSQRIWIRGLEQEVRRLSPDLVHVHGIANFSAVRVALLKHRLPTDQKFRLIYDCHMVQGEGRHPLRRLAHPMFRVWARLIRSQADALVGVAEDAVRYMHEVYGLSQSELHLVPLGASTERFHFDRGVRRRVRARLAFSDSDVVFIYAGKLNPIKGPHLLVKAALALMADDEHIRVLIIGGGSEEYVSRMQKLVTNHGCSSHFLWTPTVSNIELAKYYCAADVGVWPRMSSLTMLEAQACRLPIIVSDHPVASERVRVDNGLVFRSDDVEDLARQMKRLANSADLRREMGENGWRYVSENLSYTTLSRQFIALACGAQTP